ncbi:AAA family ATPase [Kitasatospora sp. NPDC049285]|uniref:dTMP kinase n=1 Tax=Kitasatospora sp. NPDC049285 TaxID=3157096 RepID=UPI00343415D6
MTGPASTPSAERGPGSITKHALLIAVEGTDGAGKTTAALSLVEELRARGRSVTWFPNRTLRPVREALNRLAREEGLDDRFALFGRDFAQLLSGVSKWRELLDLEPALARPDHVVVVDRYLHAQFALARAFDTGNEPLLRRLFAAFPAPDAVVYLDLDPAVAAERVLRRGRDRNAVEFLREFRTAFHALPEFPSFHVIDAARPPDQVARQALDAVAPLLAGHDANAAA